jgi:type IV secretory pathway VirB6-like protein
MSNIKKFISYFITAVNYSSFVAVVIVFIYCLGAWIPSMDLNLCIERYSPEDLNRDIETTDKVLINDYQRFDIKANGVYKFKQVAKTTTDSEDGSELQSIEFLEDLDFAGSWKETVSIGEGEKLDLHIEGEIDLGSNKIPSYDGEYILRDYGHNNKYDDMISWKAGTRIPRMEEDAKIIFLQQDEYPTTDSPEKAKRYPVMNVAGGEKFEITVGEADTSDNSKEITDIFGNTISTSSCNKHHSIPVLCNMHYIGLTDGGRHFSGCNNKADYTYDSKTPVARGGQLLFFRGKKEDSEDINDIGFMVNGGIANQDVLKCGFDVNSENWSSSWMRDYCRNNFNSGGDYYIKDNYSYDCVYKRGYDYDEDGLKNRLEDIGFTAVNSPTITQDDFSELTYGESTILELSPVLPEGVLYPRGSWDEVKKYGFTNDIRTPHERSNGGYYVKIKQSGMVTKNNEPINKYGLKRGDLRLIVMPAGVNPNNVEDLEEVKLEELTLSKSRKVESKQFWETNKASSNGNVWALIRNDNADDRRDSEGFYKVKFIGETRRVSARNAVSGSFSEEIAKPAINFVLNEFEDKFKGNFKRLICYDTPNKQCSSFMTYVRLLLNLYVVITAIQFLLGSISLSQMEFIKRIIKIAVVSSLTTGAAFELFDNYIFDLVIRGGADLLASFSGVSVDSPSTHPFAFADEFMSEVIFTKRGVFKILAIVSIFPQGLMMCFITMISTALAVQAIIRVLVIYLMALIALSLLLTIAPIFLTFLLFDKTKTLFDNWVSTVVRYILEPPIVFIGVPVLVKFVAISFDKITGFSVCFKCVTPFAIPVSEILGGESAAGALTLGCITWFAPWGFDPVFNDASEFNLYIMDFLVMFLVSMILSNYVNIANQLVNSLTPGLGSGESAPPVSGAAQKLESAAKQNVSNIAKSGQNAFNDARQGIKDARERSKKEGEYKSGNSPQEKENSEENESNKDDSEDTKANNLGKRE